MFAYKQKCVRCTNKVLITFKSQYPLCYDCQKNGLKGSIKDSKMKKLFDIPEEFYRRNAFLCSIKFNYLKFGALSDKQIEFFKKTVDEMKSGSKSFE